jgi:hypothetical protein
MTGSWRPMRLTGIGATPGKITLLCGHAPGDSSNHTFGEDEQMLTPGLVVYKRKRNWMLSARPEPSRSRVDPIHPTTRNWGNVPGFTIYACGATPGRSRLEV